MAWTTTDIEKIEKAIATGSRKVKYGDKEVEYHTLSEMMSLLELMRSEVNGKPSLADRRTMGIVKSTTNF